MGVLWLGDICVAERGSRQLLLRYLGSRIVAGAGQGGGGQLTDEELYSVVFCGDVPAFREGSLAHTDSAQAYISLGQKPVSSLSLGPWPRRRASGSRQQNLLCGSFLACACAASLSQLFLTRTPPQRPAAYAPSGPDFPPRSQGKRRRGWPSRGLLTRGRGDARVRSDLRTRRALVAALASQPQSLGTPPCPRQSRRTIHGQTLCGGQGRASNALQKQKGLRWRQRLQHPSEGQQGRLSPPGCQISILRHEQHPGLLGGHAGLEIECRDWRWRPKSFSFKT